MMITDEQLSAYLDGELEPAELDRVEQVLENDPELAARFEKLAGSDQLLKDALKPLADQKVPDAISALLDEPGDSEPEEVSLPQAANDNGFWQRWSLPIAASIALFVGFVIGNYGNSDPQIATEQFTGIISSQNPLHDILENQPSGKTLELADDGKAEVLLSFANKDGIYCREFTVSSADKTNRAIACREGQWNIRLSSQSEKAGSDSTYRTASSENDILFDQFIDSQMRDDALDAEAEQEVMRRDWQD